jgi:integrase
VHPHPLLFDGLTDRLKNDAHRQTGKSTPTRRHSKKLDVVTPADCANVLRPIWLEKAETASRTRQRMHAVMQWAWAHGHITANPVGVVDHILPKQNAKKEHQPAMPWRDAPASAKAQLRDIEPADNTRAALLFLILTAARSGEIRGATWGEFDLDAGIWTVPGERMKAKKPHRVPLSSPALDIVKTLKEQQQHETLVFPSPRGKVLSDMTLTALLRRVKAKSDTPGRVATAHDLEARSEIGPANRATPATLPSAHSRIPLLTRLKPPITARTCSNSASR